MERVKSITLLQHPQIERKAGEQVWQESEHDSQERAPLCELPSLLLQVSLRPLPDSRIFKMPSPAVTPAKSPFPNRRRPLRVRSVGLPLGLAELAFVQCPLVPAQPYTRHYDRNEELAMSQQIPPLVAILMKDRARFACCRSSHLVISRGTAQYGCAR